MQPKQYAFGPVGSVEKLDTLVADKCDGEIDLIALKNVSGRKVFKNSAKVPGLPGGACADIQFFRYCEYGRIG